MSQTFDLWVLCPPERGQGDLKRVQRQLGLRDERATALPPFLPLGHRGEVPLKGPFNSLGDWKVGALDLYKGFVICKSRIEGLDLFAANFEPVPMFPRELILAAGEWREVEISFPPSIFHTYDLALWRVALKGGESLWDWVEVEALQRHSKKRREETQKENSTFAAPFIS